jgi:hypothetical protein
VLQDLRLLGAHCTPTACRVWYQGLWLGELVHLEVLHLNRSHNDENDNSNDL